MSLIGDVAGVASGLLNKGGIPTPDLTKLFETIKNSGIEQRNLINGLPENLKPLYQQYIASTNQAGQNLQTGTTALGQNLMAQTAANHSPEVAQAAEDAAKTAIYANLPSQQNAIRQALAATGGFDRGTAAKQLAAPVLEAGQQFGQQVANITAQQLQAKQQATQQAINTVNTMNDQVLQSLFGMTKQQAQEILTSNRQDLKDQLTELINQSQNETNQTLGVQGAGVMNAYNKSLAEKAQSDALNNSFVQLGADALASAPGFLSGLDINSPTSPNAIQGGVGGRTQGNALSQFGQTWSPVA